MFKPTEASERNRAAFGWFLLGSMNKQTTPMKDQTIMEKQRLAVTHDLSMLAEDARALMVATADLGGEKVKDARNRVAAALDGCREIYDQVRDRGIDGARAADRGLRDSPYIAVGITVAVG